MVDFIPQPVVKRLPMYYRYLKKLESEGRMFVSSAALAEMAGLTASQVRQDMNILGGEGCQGRGYPVGDTCRHIAELMGITRRKTMMIVGMGNLGSALVHYSSFDEKSFETVAVFDSDPCKIGTKVGSQIVRSADGIESFLKAQKADIAVLTLPAASAQAMAEKLYGLGVRGFWNFAPVDLHLPGEAAVVNVHLDESLQLLSYRMAHPDMWGAAEKEE